MNQKGQQRIDPSDIKKILIVRLRRIGDIIMTTPSVSALRKGFPDAFISYIVEEPYRELVEGNPDLDKNVVLDFHGGPRASLITLFSKAKLKIGYRIKYRNFIYHIRLPRKPEDGHFHSVENHVNFVRALGINVESPPPLCLPPAKKTEAEKVKNFIEENRLEGNKIIAIHISAGNEFRNWGVDNWIRLTDLLAKRTGIKIILIGASEDKEANKEILKKSKNSHFSLVGKLNLREVRELISLSSLFVGPDSGPMHIAASTSTPIIALFGPTLPENFAPWKAIATLIEKKFDCRPCKQRGCIHEDFRCLRKIKPEEIYQACLRFI